MICLLSGILAHPKYLSPYLVRGELTGSLFSLLCTVFVAAEKGALQSIGTTSIMMSVDQATQELMLHSS